VSPGGIAVQLNGYALDTICHSSSTPEKWHKKAPDFLSGAE
jgi:hypothetical protein